MENRRISAKCYCANRNKCECEYMVSDIQTNHWKRNSNEVSLLAQIPARTLYCVCVRKWGRDEEIENQALVFGYFAEVNMFRMQQLDFETLRQIRWWRWRWRAFNSDRKLNRILPHWLQIFDYWFAYFSGNSLILCIAVQCYFGHNGSWVGCWTNAISLRKYNYFPKWTTRFSRMMLF